jgi:DNA-directed RNA polymerase specialized sigma24 family protein
MTTYKVRAKRWEHGWELHIEGVGVTQSRSLRDAEMMARDYIMLDTGAPAASFTVEIIPEIGGGLDEQTRDARQAVTDADRAQRAAAERSREAARQLQRAGLSGRDIAKVLNVSPQRVSQLLKTGA